MFVQGLRVCTLVIFLCATVNISWQSFVAFLVFLGEYTVHLIRQFVETNFLCRVCSVNPQNPATERCTTLTNVVVHTQGLQVQINFSLLSCAALLGVEKGSS